MNRRSASTQLVEVKIVAGDNHDFSMLLMYVSLYAAFSSVLRLDLHVRLIEHVSKITDKK
ncbi:hypothetical protein SAMN05421736_101384 [Evansella caseinilytica]|uniref:Uncharacterized protein n=1 Tax=Evansella caseinilytica TaxID=1503961 RepID=A0A1H3H7S6_9BACI|nr:hypothetical protein [Evansella caseinilytica]SDY10699.1 hypothetical protein SAMN05421736_101384 [Evansella caseinilytica]